MKILKRFVLQLTPEQDEAIALELGQLGTEIQFYVLSQTAPLTNVERELRFAVVDLELGNDIKAVIAGSLQSPPPRRK